VKKGKQKAIILIGAVAATGCILPMYCTLKKKGQDRLSAKLLKEVNKLIKPEVGLGSEEALDIHYYDKVAKSVGGPLVRLKAEVALQYAQEIHSAWGPWWLGGDDEQKVYSVLRKLKGKLQVSQVAMAYAQAYGANLVDELYDRLDATEIQRALSIIRALPGYRKAQ